MLAGQLGMRMVNQLLYEGVITSGDLHIATRDGEAMFFHDSIDFSAYAGTDGGSTPYRFVFTDSAGKVATAYGGAAGGGEALGAETVVNGGFDADTNWSKDTGWTISAGVASCDGSQGSVAAAIYQPLSVLSGQLCKAAYDLTRSAGYAYCRIGASAMGSSYSSNGSHIDYITYDGAGGNHNIFGNSDFVGTVDNFSIKLLTDIPATGLHLMSTKNGTTRNMASVESGFNPNKIVGVKIYG
jgi:hypothetical protein